MALATSFTGLRVYACVSVDRLDAARMRRGERAQATPLSERDRYCRADRLCVHAAGRLLHRQRRSATIDRSLHASSGALELVVAGYGTGTLPAGRRWPPGECPGAGCSRSGLPDSPWRHLDAVWRRACGFCSVPSGAGRLCGHDRPPGARDVPRTFTAQAAPSAKPVRRCRRTGYRRRPARRRTARHRQHRWDHMATDLLGQRPHRPRHTQRRQRFVPATRSQHAATIDPAGTCCSQPRSSLSSCPRRRPIKWVADVDLGRSRVRPHRRLPHDPC